MECFMRRIYQLSIACLATGVVSACKSPEQVIQTGSLPTAGVRFINAVPDTGGGNGMDFRFEDINIVENSAQPAITFRNNAITAAGWTGSNQIQFKAARAGTRHFKIFLDDTLQSVASTVMNTPTLAIDPISASIMPNDTTLIIEANKNYTVILWGNARGGASAMRITAFEDDPVDPAANVALRVINATSTAITASAFLTSAGAPGTPTWPTVAPFSVSSFVAGPPGLYSYTVTGGTTVSGSAMPGAPATTDIPSLPGTTVAGSAVTGIVFPRSVAGSTAPQAAAFTTPILSFMWDRRPPRGCDPKLC
jgi:hypothetical protein